MFRNKREELCFNFFSSSFLLFSFRRRPTTTTTTRRENVCEIFPYWFHVFIHETALATLSILTFISSTKRWELQSKPENIFLAFCLYEFIRESLPCCQPYSIFLLFHFYINTHSWMPCANWKFYRSNKTHKSINLTYSTKLFSCMTRNEFFNFGMFSSGDGIYEKFR